MEKDNMMGMATDALAIKKPAKKPVIKMHMRIEPDDDKGYIVEKHEHADGHSTGKMTKHAVADLNGIHNHLKDTYGPSDWEMGKNDRIAEPKGEKKEAAGAKEGGE